MDNTDFSTADAVYNSTRAEDENLQGKNTAQVTKDAVTRLRSWLTSNSFDAIIISRRDNYTWLTSASKRNYVLSNAPVGIASLFVTSDSIEIIADNIDGGRIIDEKIDIPARLIQYPWHADSDDFYQKLIVGKRVAADTDIRGTENVSADLVDIRSILSEDEKKLYRANGNQCAMIVESSCKEAEIGMTENQIATLVKQKCLAVGISPDCVLVGSDERIDRYRHPMPTEKALRQRLMIVLGAERGGLNVSLTRFASFGQPSDEYLTRFAKTQQIFAGMLDQTRNGIQYVDYFRHVQRLYAAAGYPAEWHKHHQGGPTGYACREKIIKPDSSGEINLNQAFAWNPSITGTKSEETILLNSDGIEILTRTNDWPTANCQSYHGSIDVANILIR